MMVLPQAHRGRLRSWRALPAACIIHTVTMLERLSWTVLPLVGLEFLIWQAYWLAWLPVASLLWLPLASGTHGSRFPLHYGHSICFSKVNFKAITFPSSATLSFPGLQNVINGLLKLAPLMQQTRGHQEGPTRHPGRSWQREGC